MSDAAMLTFAAWDEPFSFIVLSWGRCGGTQRITLAKLELLEIAVKLRKAKLNNSKGFVFGARLTCPARLDQAFYSVLG